MTLVCGNNGYVLVGRGSLTTCLYDQLSQQTPVAFIEVEEYDVNMW